MRRVFTSILSSALLLAAALSDQAQAQIVATLKLNKKLHLEGEPVRAILTVTNHAGRPLLFASDGRQQWLTVIVRDNTGNLVSPRANRLFGPMKIETGQTLSREIDIASLFRIDQSQNYSANVVIRSPGGTDEGTTSNRVFFNLATGLRQWTQRVGVPGSRAIREYRLLRFAGDSKTMLYAQVADGRSGQTLHTIALAEFLAIRRPQAMVDKAQRMHTLFIATPTMWVHAVVDTDGRLIDRKIHKRPAMGDPMLAASADGTVRVTNSLPYDPKAVSQQKSATRRASERPPGIR
jgi:hypothetical protein